MFMKPAIINILAGMISLSGLVVMAGWLLDIPILASWIPGAITMKFITAISFVLSGAVLYFIGRAPRPGGDSVGDIVLTTASFTLALVMGTFLLSIAAGIHTGIEDIFVRDLTPAVHASVPGRPAVPTAIAFVLIAVSGLFWTARFKKRVVVIKVCGAIVGAIGGIAMLGYALDQPALYYAVEGVSNPIALSTATLFFMLGAGLRYAAGAAKEPIANSSSPML